ncbi:dipeptide ABC transporter substrate-binding protein [Microbacterium sp. TS-1]|uniref:ABC transporter substrate-binding protein n=1 Tax=Microbacterium TaxID=33882 RepID=UPI00038F7DAA|nr:MULTISPECIES: ABC transporter substrate-binding protein [Microbacterium]APF35418.1 peptide ABC transporter substrate-binding protein [Microbacterium paludicola]GAD35538.1 dipeptide ABC transporter substrate-binding protein [Microbacterium sp. TS-1]
MLRRTTVTAAALLAAGTLLLAGCTGSTEPGPSATMGAPDPDASVNIRLVLEPSNLDIRQTAGISLEQILIDNVYQGLVARTIDGEVVDGLASSHEVSADGLTYTFTLREGIVFHDGQPLTPQDVVWSLTTHRDTAEFADSERLANVASINADGQTITLILNQPDSSLLWNLTGRAGLIMKEGDTVDYSTKANGTGPYRLGDWRQGASLTLERNDAYWGDAAKVAEVSFVFIPDTQAAINAALTGEVDVLTGFDANLAEQVEANGDFVVDTGVSTGKSVLAMNSTTGPLADVRVREAIRSAIDHDAIVEAVGAGQTLFGPIPELDPGYEDLSDVVSYDPEAARALLSDAGVSDLSLTLTIPSDYGTTVPQILVSNFNDVGIDLRVNPVDFGTWLSDVYTNKDYELSVVNHAEPRDFENWANPDYYFTYDNAEVQDLYAQSLLATDEQSADDLLKKAARIVSEDHAADWLYNWASVVAVATNVSGMPIDNVNARINLAEIAKSDG